MLTTCATASTLAYGEFHESKLDSPTLTLAHGPAEITQALALIHPEPNVNHVELTTSVQLDDLHDWAQHMANAATANGWFPYDTREGTLKVILPKEDLHILQNAVNDPYRWIQKNQRQDASPLNLKERPIIATVTAQQQIAPTIIWLMLAVASTFAAFTAGVIAFFTFLYD